METTAVNLVFEILGAFELAHIITKLITALDAPKKEKTPHE